MSTSPSSMLRVTIALVVLLLLPLRAHGQASPDEAVEKLTQLNKDAIAAFQAKKYDDARKILKQALDMAATVNLDGHPIAARTHIHMGIVIMVGFNQRDLAIKQFKKAIEIQADINLTKALVTPELTSAFDEAKKPAGVTPPPATAADAKPGTPPPPATPPSAAAASKPADESGSGLTHEAVTEGKQGSAISITVGVQRELQFEKLVLAYRPDGSTEFLGREMKQESEGSYAAEIPDTATSGSVVAYYIEAQDAEGGLIASRGSVDLPLVIHLAGVGARRHDVGGGGGDDENDDEDEPNSRIYVGLLAGTGVGWASGDGDTNAGTPISPPGVAMAGVGQISPEVGYWLSSSLMLSVQLRYEYITGTTDIHTDKGIFHTANYAFAGFARATWKYGEEKLHPFFSLAVGAGRIRHVVSFARQDWGNTCGPNRNQTCIDTIGAGPVFLGPGAGLMYDLTDTIALVGQVNSVVGFPTFTVNLDANVGVAFGF